MYFSYRHCNKNVLTVKPFIVMQYRASRKQELTKYTNIQLFFENRYDYKVFPADTCIFVKVVLVIEGYSQMCCLF